MGQTPPANQFIAGLHPELKKKLIGVEGLLEELILKARFEEAKGREFAVEKDWNEAPKEQAAKCMFPQGSHLQLNPTTNL